MNSLQRAQDIFRSLREKVSEARVILTRVNFVYQNLQSNQLIFMSQIDDLIRISQIFEQNDCKQHQTKCLIYIAQIKYDLEEFQASKQFISNALSIARSIQDQQQLKVASQILNNISIQIQKESNNLIISLNSYPLVEMVNDEIHELENQNHMTIKTEGMVLKMIYS